MHTYTAIHTVGQEICFSKPISPLFFVLQEGTKPGTHNAAEGRVGRKTQTDIADSPAESG